MPELPEVETIRRQLDPELRGQQIERVEVLDPRFTRPLVASSLIDPIAGRVVRAVGRRGKYLLIELVGDLTAAVHLRMTGNLVIAGRAAPPPPHLRAAFWLDDGRVLWYTDPRRFGHSILLPDPEMDAYLDERLGPEPLSADFTPEYLAALAAGRRVPLKSFLLIQSGIAGIGNIYADEALHRAELHPLAAALSIKPRHCTALHGGIVAALEEGLANGGASIDDYRDARGEKGSMQDEFLVHRREGEDCPRCGAEIRRIVVGGRSTYFCGGCQRRPRARRR